MWFPGDTASLLEAAVFPWLSLLNKPLLLVLVVVVSVMDGLALGRAGGEAPVIGP